MEEVWQLSYDPQYLIIRSLRNEALLGVFVTVIIVNERRKEEIQENATKSAECGGNQGEKSLVRLGPSLMAFNIPGLVSELTIKNITGIYS